MTLSEFIRAHKEAIMQEWEDFARTVPAAKKLSRKSLRDHISTLLDFIAGDIASPQTPLEQADKSRGRREGNEGDRGGRTHANLRFTDGFDIVEMASEFRALRASVIKLWRREDPRHMENDFEQAARFHEAIDQLQMESLEQYDNALNQSRALFLGTLVHDMRNPLGAAANSVELLKTRGTLDPVQLKLVEQIGRSCKTVTKLVGELIDATRLHLGKGLPIRPAPMEMKEVVCHAVAEAKAKQPAREITVETQGDLKGEWDGARIGQVLSNLVGNALQHGSATAAVQVRASGGPRGVVLSVHNEGDPIPPEALPTVFEPLTRGNGERQKDSKQGSLGLGLFISKEIVAAHGGKMDVSSSEEEGTTFSAWLPRAAPSVTGAKA